MWGRTKYDLCTKDPAAPATCALCGWEHPASYTGCIIYEKLQQARGKTHHPIHRTAVRTSITPVNINDATQFLPLILNMHPFSGPEPPSSSNSRTVTHHQQPINTTQQLSIFLNEFKTMFSQLIQQNGMILNMISTVIQKLTNWWTPFCVLKPVWTYDIQLWGCDKPSHTQIIQRLQ